MVDWSKTMWQIKSKGSRSLLTCLAKGSDSIPVVSVHGLQLLYGSHVSILLKFRQLSR